MRTKVKFTSGQESKRKIVVIAFDLYTNIDTGFNQFN